MMVGVVWKRVAGVHAGGREEEVSQPRRREMAPVRQLCWLGIGDNPSSFMQGFMQASTGTRVLLKAKLQSKIKQVAGCWCCQQRHASRAAGMSGLRGWTG